MTMEPEVCRLCLTPVDPSTVVVLNEAVNLIESIQQVTTIDVLVDTTHRVFICNECRNTLDVAIHFRTMCLQNDDVFRKMYAKHSFSSDGAMETSDKWETEFVRCKVEVEAAESDAFVSQESEVNIHEDEVLNSDNKPSTYEVPIVEAKKSHKKRKPKKKIGNAEEKQNEQSSVQKNKKLRKKSETKSKPPSDDPIAKVQCQSCGEFFTRDVLRKHLLTHRKDRPMYACVQCPKKYPHRKNLKEHIEIVHEGKVVHSCDRCGKAYSRKDALKQHYMAEHTDLKKYECNVCGEKFARSSNLNYHHTMNHSSARPHACEYCAMTFKRSNDLKLHVRTHTGEKPFKCDLCDKRFAKSYNVVIHKKSHKNAEMKLAAPPKVDNADQGFNFSDTGAL